MTTNQNIPEMESEIPSNAVSLYGQNADALEDFPVLRAFQQYIDAEQSKARKRMVMLCSFFGFLMVAVIIVFVIILFSVSSRNQALNDRLIEYVMRDRGASSPVVVQSPADGSAIMALSTRLEAMQKQLSTDQAKVVADAQRAALESVRPKPPTDQELEILRLKAQLAQEKEKAALKREIERQAEIEAYRRKHYPECYAQPQPASSASSHLSVQEKEADDDIDQLLRELNEKDILEDGLENDAANETDSGKQKPTEANPPSPSAPKGMPKPGEWTIPTID